jgi:hypothetical protein
MKRSKKIPKTHLPKYAPGGVSNTKSLYDTEPTGNDATSSLYNEKRGASQKSTVTSDMATAAAGTLGNYTAVANNPNLNSAQRNTAYGAAANQTADAIIGAIPVFGQYYGLVKGGADMLTNATTSSNINPETGKKSYKQGTDAVVGELLTPTHTSQINAVTDFANGKGDVGSGIAAVLGASSIYNAAKGSGIFGGKDEYAENEKLIAAENQKQQELLAQQQAAYQQQQNDYINNAIQAGMANYQSQPQGTTIQYAHGGMSIQPNAEIEKQENVVAPNGGFLQADGPTHEQGGVPVALPGNSMIFSDRLKLGKKTFAELNKVNNISKEDKILESNKYGNTSKRTAELMKFAKNKNSQELFNAQEALKQAKVEAYAKKMGVNLNQSSEASQEFPMGGVKLPMYPYGGEGNMLSYGDDPRFYNYQGNKVIAPNLKALSKDKGVSTDIGLNNYNNLLNTRTQVRDSNVQMDKQLPKFEYLNDPTKGTYDEQFNDYKKVYLPGFAMGGRKLSQYEFGVLTPEEEGDDLESVWKSSSAKIDAQHRWNSNNKVTSSAWSPEELQASSEVSSVGSKRDQELYDAELARMNASGGRNTNKFDWKNILGQVGNFAAQNAGNIYNLSRYNKPEVESYERMKATYLDPSAALRDAEAQTRRAEYNVRGASGGNAGTYLSNRVALNAQNTINKARIHTDYQNANAGISNSVGQYNNELARQEVIANAMNRARNRSGKGEAIGSLGSNVANQMMDNKKTNMDQETLQLMMKYYNDPQFKKYLEESGFNKKKTGK